MMSEKLEENTIQKKGDYRGTQVISSLNSKGHVTSVCVKQIGQSDFVGGIRSLIDHTLLKPDSIEEQMVQFCNEAVENNFNVICVNAYWVPFCVSQLRGSAVKVGATVGFPLGATTTEVKVFEAKQAIKNGAGEIDMVLNIGALKSGQFTEVFHDIREVVRVCHKHDVLIKVILENCLLSDLEKVAACLIAQQAGADFVKTSTGFNGKGATVEDVRLMREVVGSRTGVKASGGIRSYEDAKNMVEAGANRIGTSAGITIALEESGQKTNETSHNVY
ncbi:MAG: deoxyribose-phosphate aldolase [Anaerolineaceae bacterium]|nr:deoxyribose-phosphate aldolase [Anaerolineaceae bacterium]